MKTQLKSFVSRVSRLTSFVCGAAGVRVLTLAAVIGAIALPAQAAKVTVSAVTGASSAAYTNGVSEATRLPGESPYTVEMNAQVSVVYAAEDGYVFPDGLSTFTTNVTASAPTMTVTLTANQLPKVAQRAPDYAEATGQDWLYNHNIPERRYAGEPAQDPGVDLFYIYPTIAMTNADTTVKGYVSIDDPQIRGDEASKTGGAWSVFEEQGRVFADMTHVYAPFYRQASIVKAFEGSDQPKTWMETFLKGLEDNQPYADIKAALDEYFTHLNPNGERPFILAGHSQGSSMLILVMENYFTGEKAKCLRNMIACYALGTGIGRAWMDRVTPSTRNAEGLVNGITFATNATDVGVVISWNTEGPGANHSTACFPEDMMAINPLTWTTNTTPAGKALNLGAWTTNKNASIVKPSLYGATVNGFGMVACGEMPDSQYANVPNDLFGSKTLHGWDYKAWWDNIHANGLQRIQTWKAAHGVPVHSQLPLVGRPIDFADAFNWVTNSISATGVTRDVDALFFYPAQEMTGDSTFMPVTDEHKAKACNWCKDKSVAFAGYANIVMPAYRQMNRASATAGQALYATDSELFDYLRPTLSRTDLFAALDYYFTVINKDGRRPFFLAGHSQGSAQIKVLLLDYFTREENKAKLRNLIAVYAIGCAFSADWIDNLGIGVKAVTGETDTKVVIAWNTEGPDAQERNLVIRDGAIAINPMNWTTNANVWSETTPDAMIQERGGYAPGTHVLVTTNSDAYLSPECGMGKKSLHAQDWSLWLDQIRANGWTRYRSVSDLKKVETSRVPSVEGATWKVEVKGDGQAWNAAVKSPVDGNCYVSGSAQADSVRLTYTLDDPASGKRFYGGETTASFPMAYDGVKGVWATTATETEIKAATKADMPKVQLGAVAQRYPWNGMLDIQYMTPNANATRDVAFSANGVELGTAKGTGGEAATASFDLNSSDAFRDKRLKSVKITAAIK